MNRLSVTLQALKILHPIDICWKISLLQGGNKLLSVSHKIVIDDSSCLIPVLNHFEIFLTGDRYQHFFILLGSPWKVVSLNGYCNNI